MKSELSKNRTFLMGLAMIAIVCFHHDWMVIPVFTTIFSPFGLWGVDIFMFLSGFGCVYALNKYTTGEFWKKRIIRLLPTCLLVGILICCVDLIFNAERTHTYLLMRLFSLHRWYIHAILMCYILCPLFYVILKKYDGWGLIILITVAIIIYFILPVIPVWRINWAFSKLPVFLIGMYIGLFDLKITKLQYAISGVCLIVAIITRCRGGVLRVPMGIFSRCSNANGLLHAMQTS